MSYRNDLITKILDAADTTRRTVDVIVERNELQGSDGKWYSGSFPRGVSFTGEKRPYWVLSSRRDGTTYGQRFATRPELEAHYEQYIKRNRDVFARELYDMTAQELENQAQYWLKTA